MAGRSSAALAAVLGLGAAAGLFVASARETPRRGPEKGELTAFASELDGLLRESSASVSSRARTVAESPRLAYAVAADEATVRDMIEKELAFRVKPGETLEIGQVFTDGTQQVLLRVPADMKLSPPLGTPGQHLMMDGDKVVVAEVVKVTPKERADQLYGAIAVSQELSLGALVDRLDQLGSAARVELDGKTIIAGSRVAQAGSATEAVMLQSPLGMRVKVIAEVTPAATTRSGALLGGAVLVALAGLGGAGLLFVRGAAGRSAAASSPGAGGVPSSVVVRAAGSSPGGTSAGALSDQEARAGTDLAAAAGGLRGRAAPRLSSEQRTPGPAPLGSFGRYTLLKLLGSGGMAEVYLARSSGEAGFEKQVALKIMHANLATQEKVVDLFLDEARIVSRLTHPNIVQISDLGRDGTDYFIAMEYVEGSDLDKLLHAVRARGEAVPLRVGLTILRKICDGLHAAHVAVDAEGKPLELVHRDVKSENVFLSRGGAVKVGDFGIAKANQQVHKTQHGELKGTAAYMAPEHRTGQAVDLRADVYGVGAIAYELLTGAEVNLDLAMLAHLGRTGWPHLAPPTQVRGDLPPELDAIIFKALSYERDDRYATCEAFEEALDAVGTRYGLTASDKVVAQWVEAVLAAAPASPASAAGTPAQGGGAA